MILGIGVVQFVSSLFTGNGILRNLDAVTYNNLAWYGALTHSGDATGYCGVFLVNPTGSGKLVIVDAVTVSVTVAGGISLSYGATGRPASGTAWKDARQGGAVSLTYMAGITSTANRGTIYRHNQQPAAQAISIPLPYPIILAENQDIAVLSDALTGAVNVSFTGREVTPPA